MKRICFQLQVKPDRLEEYKQRHKEVWPEMLQALRQTGWHNYSLFLREDGLLIGYLETENFEAARTAMSKLPINSQWQSGMQSFFINSSDRPDRQMQTLEEVFHLD